MQGRARLFNSKCETGSSVNIVRLLPSPNRIHWNIRERSLGLKITQQHAYVSLWATHNNHAVSTSTRKFCNQNKTFFIHSSIHDQTLKINRIQTGLVRRLVEFKIVMPLWSQRAWSLNESCLFDTNSKIRVHNVMPDRLNHLHPEERNNLGGGGPKYFARVPPPFLSWNF